MMKWWGRWKKDPCETVDGQGDETLIFDSTRFDTHRPLIFEGVKGISGASYVLDFPTVAIICA